MDAETDTPPASGRAWHALRSVAQLALLWAVLWGLATEGLVRLEGFYHVRPLGLAAPALGYALFVLASLLALWAAASPEWLPLDRPARLVVSGPYRWVRNPMTAATLVQGLALAWARGSTLLLASVVVAWVAWEGILHRSREAALDARLGDAWRSFRRRVRAWRPALAPYDPARESELPALSTERTQRPAEGRTVLLYDGLCRFCSRSAARLVRLGGRGALVKRDFQEPGVLEAFPGVTHAACMREMHLVAPDGAVYAGAEAVARTLATLPFVGVLAYGYYLPGLRLLVDGVYALVARYRYRLFGTSGESCTDGTCALHVRS